MTALHLLISRRRFDRCLLQIFSLDLSALNFAEMVRAASIIGAAEFQHSCTVSAKSLCSAQKFSKRKTFALGILVLITIWQGRWSEVIFAKGNTFVFGYSTVQFGDVKNQSSCSNNGSDCMLLQVYALPFKGNSTKPMCPIASLKMNWPFEQQTHFRKKVIRIEKKAIALAPYSLRPYFRVVLCVFCPHSTQHACIWPSCCPNTGNLACIRVLAKTTYKWGRRE
jgi:hypothetical protein